MSNITVVLVFGNEGRRCEVTEGAGKDEIVRLFHTLFHDRSGSVLQFTNKSTSNACEWFNCNDDFRLSSSIPALRLVKSAEKALGLGNLSPATSLVFCCDMQERFRPAIKYFDEIVSVGSRILQAATLFNIPTVVTEQYPRGLGKTVSELPVNDQCCVVEKTKFSMLVSDVEAFLDSYPHATSVILFGVEAHVCVQQTVLDLIKRGFDVHVVADATSSRSLSDRMLAYERFRRLGAFVTSCETVLLQWVGDKQHEHFKAIQGLIKDLPADTGLFKSSI